MERMLYSMIEILPIFDQLLNIIKPRSIVEVGSFLGWTTDKLCEWAVENDATVDAIELTPPDDLLKVVEAYEDVVTLHAESSLTALKTIADKEFFIIDSDHNYYTMTSELKLIFGNNTPSIVIIHDVSWPWARRDDYIDPGLIPSEYVHEYTDKIEIEYTEIGAMRKDFKWGGYAWSVKEGEPRMGILTAIEDFFAKRDDYTLFTIDAIYGFGFLVRNALPEFDEVKAYLSPFVDNFLISKLEANRNLLYLNLLGTEQDIEEKNRHLQAYEKTVAGLRGDIEEKNEHLQEYEKTVEALRADIEEKNEHLQEYEKTVEALRGDIEEKNGHLQEYEKTVEALWGDIEEKNGHLQEYEKTVEALRGDIEEKNRHLQEYEKTVEALQADIKAKNEHLEAYEQTVSSLYKDIEAKNEHLYAYEQTMSSLHEQMADKDHHLREYEKTVADLNARMNQFSTQIEHLNAEHARLQKIVRHYELLWETRGGRLLRRWWTFKARFTN